MSFGFQPGGRGCLVSSLIVVKPGSSCRVRKCVKNLRIACASEIYMRYACGKKDVCSYICKFRLSPIFVYFFKFSPPHKGPHIAPFASPHFAPFASPHFAPFSTLISHPKKQLFCTLNKALVSSKN